MLVGGGLDFLVAGRADKTLVAVRAELDRGCHDHVGSCSVRAPRAAIRPPACAGARRAATLPASCRVRPPAWRRCTAFRPGPARRARTHRARHPGAARSEEHTSELP